MECRMHLLLHNLNQPLSFLSLKRPLDQSALKFGSSFNLIWVVSEILVAVLERNWVVGVGNIGRPCACHLSAFIVWVLLMSEAGHRVRFLFQTGQITMRCRLYFFDVVKQLSQVKQTTTLFYGLLRETIHGVIMIGVLEARRLSDSAQWNATLRCKRQRSLKNLARIYMLFGEAHYQHH